MSLKIIYNFKIVKQYAKAGCYYCGTIVDTEDLENLEIYNDDSVDCPECNMQSLVPMIGTDSCLNKLNLMMLLGIYENQTKILEEG